MTLDKIKRHYVLAVNLLLGKGKSDYNPNEYVTVMLESDVLAERKIYTEGLRAHSFKVGYAAAESYFKSWLSGKKKELKKRIQPVLLFSKTPLEERNNVLKLIDSVLGGTCETDGVVGEHTGCAQDNKARCDEGSIPSQPQEVPLNRPVIEEHADLAQKGCGKKILDDEAGNPITCGGYLMQEIIYCSSCLEKLQGKVKR